jgi:hypothetical protein
MDTVKLWLWREFPAGIFPRQIFRRVLYHFLFVIALCRSYGALDFLGVLLQICRSYGALARG